MNDKISVIIPIYNVESYLRQCLESVVKQTYSNLEILLIDDGSQDHCGIICDEYAQKDLRVKVIHKKNAGVHAAWNDGLDMATGEWVAFVDSDDWLDMDSFEKLSKAPQIDMADVVMSGGYYWEEKRGQFVRWIFLESLIAETQKERENLIICALNRPLNPKTKGAAGYLWGKLYRNSFIKASKLRFDANIRTGMMGDLLFNWDVYENATLVVCTHDCSYHYRVMGTSGTFKFDPNRTYSQEYIEKLFYARVNVPGTSEKLRKAVESRCLRDIVHNLQRCYFHPENTASNREIINGIREMKQMPYYRAAIHSTDNPYNNIKLKAFQIALRLPWVWPLRVMVTVWNIVDKRETSTV